MEYWPNHEVKETNERRGGVDHQIHQRYFKKRLMMTEYSISRKLSTLDLKENQN